MSTIVGGKNATVYIGGTQPIGHVINCRVSQSSSGFDVTCFNDSVKSYVSGIPNTTIDMTIQVDGALNESQRQALFSTGQSFSINKEQQPAFEIVEISPNILQGRMNGEPLEGAKCCPKPGRPATSV